MNSYIIWKYHNLTHSLFMAILIFPPTFGYYYKKKNLPTSLLEEPILTFLEVGSKEYIIRKTKLRFVKNVIDASALSSL